MSETGEHSLKLEEANLHFLKRNLADFLTLSRVIIGLIILPLSFMGKNAYIAVVILTLVAAVVPLMGLILNYTPWGIRLYPILLSLAIFILVTSLIVWYRRRLARVGGFTFAFNLSLLPWRGQRFIDKILSVILIAVILGTIGTLGYVIATIPRVAEKFTEFYILGLEGKAIDYPSELRVGEEGRVIVGIINREHETVNYRIEVRIDGVRNNEVGPLELQSDEKWEEVVSFTPNRARDNQKVEFVLYKEGKPYFKDPPYLLVSVKE